MTKDKIFQEFIAMNKYSKSIQARKSSCFFYAYKFRFVFNADANTFF